LIRPSHAIAVALCQIQIRLETGLSNRYIVPGFSLKKEIYLGYYL
jgi:hypothetical protein